MLSRCSCSRLRFAVFSSGGNSNRRSSCLRSAGTCAFHCPTATWRSSSPSADFWSTTLRSGGGCSVTPRKFSADCDRGSDRPTTAGGWMRRTSGLRASGSIYTGLLTPPVRQSSSFSRPKQDAVAAKRFQSQSVARGEPSRAEPWVINTYKHAAYPPAIVRLKAEGAIEEGCQHRPVQYLNNVLEQDHRAIKRLVRASRAFPLVLGRLAHNCRLRGDPYDSQRPTVAALYLTGLSV